MHYISGARTGIRQVYRFTQNWKFNELDNKAYADKVVDESTWNVVHLPHANTILPHKDFSPNQTRFVSWYRKSFQLPVGVHERRVKLFFDGVMTVADVYVNGIYQGQHKGGYTPFCVDITNSLQDGENVIAVRVDSTRRTDVPPEGFVVDYQLFGGIYRNVYLVIQGEQIIEDLFLRTEELSTDNAELVADATLANYSDTQQSVQLQLTLVSPLGRRHCTSSDPIQLAPGTTTTQIRFTLEHPEAWDIHNPSLYQVTAELLSKDGNILDDDVFRFGVRTVGIASNGLILNGKTIKLRGLNRHQAFPYIGGAASERLQRKDASILKQELGLNYVRTSHYPQDPSFLDACDELGLLVFTELPGWQHIGDENWQAVAKQHLEEMVKRDRNRACIFMWGTRINESKDNHDLYVQTGTIARALDPSRPIGGVRNFRQSEWLEDVFTLNDFSMGVMPTTHSPQLITEFLGHMYPTKSSDQEGRLAKHAVHHATIVNQVYERDDIIGGSGWCAFDYNTNESFGPGDMVCYHGVMDIFRLPKFAAHFYKSQQDPERNIVLEPATYFTFETADHSELVQSVDIQNMEEETHNDQYVTPIYVYSNCDEVEAFVNDTSVGKLPREVEQFPGLPYPPFRLDVRGYGIYGKLEFVGYKDGQEQARKHISTPMGVDHLEVTVDDDTLIADGADMTRVVIRAIDKNGMLCPYANRVVSFQVTGVGEVIGENPIALEGGKIALFIRTGVTAGKIDLRVHSAGLEDKQVTITVEATAETIY